MTSTIKVNNVQNQCGQNIINENSNTITLGASGDTIALASGASQTGFGRTGTVDWQTGSIKTSTFTADNGEGYFCDTSSGAFTVNLPAGSAGAIVSLADYASSFQTHNLTVSPNGSDKIAGSTVDVKLQTEGQSVTLVFVDSTKGWITTADSTENVEGNAFVQATGGTETTSGNCKIHTFTGPGTFTVTNVAICAANNIMSHTIVAGGGGGASGGPSTNASGGGGAGGFREVKNPVTPYTASPLDGYPSAPNRVTVTAQAYPIVVGGGGSGGDGSNTAGCTGSNSSFGGITSAGGGGGSRGAGTNGGSGSGAGGGATGRAGGTGNTPPVTPAQGSNGGGSPPANPDHAAGGGGGATEAGVTGGPGGPNPSGRGGAGATSCITASPVAYAGGGGGSASPGKGPAGAASPCGTGGRGGPPGAGVAGTTNRGGGGGGGTTACLAGGNGGSGVVVIRYKFQ